MSTHVVTEAGTFNGTTTLTFNEPTGSAEHDLMLTAVFYPAARSVLTVPTGWTLERNLAGATWECSVYSKIHDGSEPASWAWILDGSALDEFHGAVYVARGTDTDNPLDQVRIAEISSASTSSPSPDINARIIDATMVTVHAIDANTTWTPPAGMTERLDDASTVTGTLTVGVNDVELVDEGPAGERTATSVASAIGMSVAAVIRDDSPIDVPASIVATSETNASASASSITVSQPSGVRPGDVLICMLGLSGFSLPSFENIDTDTLPDGWTLVVGGFAQKIAESTDFLFAKMFTRTVTEDEPADYTWTVKTAKVLQAHIVAVRGARLESGTLDASVGAEVSTFEIPELTPLQRHSFVLPFWYTAGTTAHELDSKIVEKTAAAAGSATYMSSGRIDRPDTSDIVDADGYDAELASGTTYGMCIAALLSPVIHTPPDTVAP